MKKRLLSLLLVLIFLTGILSVQNPITIQAAAKKSSFITSKTFKGTFGYNGEKGGYETGWYNIIIYKITKNGKIHFAIDKGGRNASPLYSTDVLIAKINGNKAKFVYEDSWGNNGRGVIKFNKNGTIYLTVKQTHTAEINRSSLEISKTLFKKVDFVRCANSIRKLTSYRYFLY